MSIIEQGFGIIRVNQDPNIDIVPTSETAEIALNTSDGSLWKWDRITTKWNRLATSDQTVDPTAITVSDSDFTLPVISKMGEVYVFRNPSGGGGPAKVSAEATNEMNDSGLGGFVNVRNGKSKLFIAVSATTWISIN